MPSRSSRASRKTWLSSTRRIRIGRPMAVRTLLGREKQVVVGLAAVLHLDLDVRVRCADPLEQRLERRLVLADQQREEAARVAEQRVDHRARDLLEALADCDRLPVCEAEPLALADRDTVHLDVA